MLINTHNTRLSKDQLIIVNSNDEAQGLMDKLEAHKNGLMHRAFSVFLYRFNGDDELELLLQQRNMQKYHSAGLWSNTCCSHPMHLESIPQAAQRRLHEELHITHDSLQPIGHIQYNLPINQLSENEFDHLLIGYFDQPTEHIHPNSDEVMALQWQSLTSLIKALNHQPHRYTQWLPHVLAYLTPSFEQLHPKQGVSHA